MWSECACVWSGKHVCGVCGLSECVDMHACVDFVCKRVCVGGGGKSTAYASV